MDFGLLGTLLSLLGIHTGPIADDGVGPPPPPPPPAAPLS
jgi:hypothetical protein